MYISRPVLKHNAKFLLSSSKPSPYLIALLYLLIVGAFGYVQTKLAGGPFDEQTLRASMLPALEAGDFGFVARHFIRPSAPFMLMGFLLGALPALFEAGYLYNMLRVSRHEESHYDDIFVGFTMIPRVLFLAVVSGLLVSLWSLLFVFPGIVAAYRYRQALYILLDNPELSVLDCLRISKLLMQGRKMELFTLDLSFFGWYALCGLFLPALIYVLPYSNLTYVGYYNALVAGMRQDQASM